MLQHLETAPPSPPPPPYHQYQRPVSGNASAVNDCGRSSCLPTFLSSISTVASDESVASPVNDNALPSATPAACSGASSSSTAAAASCSSAPWTESGSGCVWIPDVNEDVMRHFLLYLYGS